MTSTFYHYVPLPMSENSREIMLGYYQLPRWLGILLALLVLFVVVGLSVALIICGVQAYSPACKDGHRAEQECRNSTHFLESQWTQAQEILLKTKAQAAIYNQTAVTLMGSLKMQQAQGQKLQEQVQELQEEVRTLKQKLQDTTQTLQDTTQKLQDTTQKLQDTTQKLQDTTQKLQDMTQKLQDTTQKLQDTTQKLQDTTQKLQDTTQKLQDTTAELNELRKDHESFGRDYGSTNSGNTLSLSVVTVLLTLSLLDLLA